MEKQTTFDRVRSSIGQSSALVSRGTLSKGTKNCMLMLGADSTAATDVRVASTLAKIIAGGDVSGRLASIVESLLWTFVSWAGSLSQAQHGKLVRAFMGLLEVLKPLDNIEDHVQDVLKLEHNILMCDKLGDIAERPKWPGSYPVRPLYKGYLGRLVSRQFARRSKDSVSFFISLLESKRAWPELQERKEIDAFTGHALAFSSVAPNMPVSTVRIIERTGVAVFGQWSPGARRVPTPTKMVPSSHACRQSTTREGGAYGLFDEMRLPQNWEIEGKLPTLCRELDLYRQKCWSGARFAAAESVEKHVDLGVWNTVKVVKIAEPAKFRLISMGDGYVYTALQPLQGQLIDCWKRQRYSTMEGDLTQKVHHLLRGARRWGFGLWCSGDYKAATDKLNMGAQLLALRSWENHPLYPLAVWSLTRNRLVYPDGSYVHQTNGQLMGHPLSFPLLCLVNLAVFRRSVARWGEETQQPSDRLAALRELVLVNGDDILFPCDDILFKIWRDESKKVGFEISLGKNYVSPIVAMINSKRYMMTAEGPILCSYLNLKLIKGFSLKTGESAATPEMIGRELNAMFEGCPRLVGCLPGAFRRFDVGKFGFRPNWFLPVHLGGFGVAPKWASASAGVTREQRAAAARFVSDERLALYRRVGPYATVLMKLLPNLPRPRLVAGPLKPSVDDYGFRFGSFDPERYEDQLSSSELDWGLRLSSIGRALIGPVEPVPVVVLARRLTYSGRLSPLGEAGLVKWWVAHDDFARLGKVPALKSLELFGDEAAHRVEFASRAISRELLRSRGRKTEQGKPRPRSPADSAANWVSRPRVLPHMTRRKAEQMMELSELRISACVSLSTWI